MKEIYLPQGYVVLVDDAAYDGLMRYRWKPLKAGNTVYASRTVGRTGKTELMHRVIAGAGPADLVDHFDNNGLNNQRYNLRLCTQSQNQIRTGPQPGTSQFKGVSWDSRRRKWVAQISHQGRRVFIGRFSHETEAALAYNERALALHGEFAYLNSVKPPDWQPPDISSLLEAQMD